MIKVFFTIFITLTFSKNLYSNEPKLEEIFKRLNSPWSLSFVSNENIIITEKSGNILHFNLIDKKI